MIFKRVTTIAIYKLAHHIVIVMFDWGFPPCRDISCTQLAFHKVLLSMIEFKLPRLSCNIIENITVIDVLIVKSLHRINLLSTIKRGIIKAYWWVLEMSWKKTFFRTTIVTDWRVIKRNFTKSCVWSHFDELARCDWTAISIIASLAANKNIVLEKLLILRRYHSRSGTS